MDTSYLIDQPVPALTPEYRAKHEALLAESQEMAEHNRVSSADSPIARMETTCTAAGMPMMMEAGYSLEIMQSAQHLTMIAEYLREVRHIYLGKPQLPAEEVPPSYSGRSVGHWEGDTLVVDTIRVRDDTLINTGMFSADQRGEDSKYIPHSDQMRLTERIRLITPDILEHQVTVTDPIAFEQPYVYTHRLVRYKDYETPEFYCNDLRQTVDEQGNLNMIVPDR